MATTLCWASIEKWAYPSWSMPILAERTYLALGLEPATFMALAGWVEFGLAILLVIGGRFSSRLAALALFIMFTAAVLEFGKVDLVGHLPIIASLALVVTRGNGDVGNVAGFSRRPMLIRLVALPVGYFASLVITTTAYFGGWRVAYDDVSRLDWNSDFDVSLIVVGLIIVSSILAMGIIALVNKRHWFAVTPRIVEDIVLNGRAGSISELPASHSQRASRRVFRTRAGTVAGGRDDRARSLGRLYAVAGYARKGAWYLRGLSRRRVDRPGARSRGP